MLLGSRRLLVKPCVFLLVLLPVSLAAQDQGVTAANIVARIQKKVGVPWQSETVDKFITGDPNTPVTGIAVVMMSTLEVLQLAVAHGDNFIITHEPTFYNGEDKTSFLDQRADAVLAAKKAYIQQHGLVIWRFHDHWHRRQPDGILDGMVHSLGWEKYQDQKLPFLFVLPPTTMEGLASALKRKLSIHVLRAIGDPDMKVTTVAFLSGSPGFEGDAGALENDRVDVEVVGEVREWETAEYAADAQTEGRHKGLIVLSHIPSEEAGMEECARWLKTFVKETRVEFISTPQPFWAPK